MSDAYQAKQAVLVTDHIAKQDIVITTALIPGRPAPRLVSRAMLAAMKPGSIAVDLAVERGGNIEGSEKGRVAEVEGVTVIGYANVAGRIAASASALYARNLYAFVESMVDKASKEFSLNLEDELIKATMLTHGGQIVHPGFRAAAEQVVVPPASVTGAEVVAVPVSADPIAGKPAAAKAVKAAKSVSAAKSDAVTKPARKRGVETGSKKETP
jgi:NAD(P) transhydrogenase subunit alpha